MPPRKVILSLTETSVNCLAKLLLNGLEPQFLFNLKLKDSSEFGDINETEANFISNTPEVSKNVFFDDVCTENREPTLGTRVENLEPTRQSTNNLSESSNNPMLRKDMLVEQSLVEVEGSSHIDETFIEGIDTVPVPVSGNVLAPGNDSPVPQITPELKDSEPIAEKEYLISSNEKDSSSLRGTKSIELDNSEEASINWTEGRETQIDIERHSLIPSKDDTTLLETAQEFMVCLAQDLASHTHCSLQELIFWSILTPLNRLYLKHRSTEMRTLIRKIVPMFINVSLRTLDFGTFRMFTEATMFQVIYRQLKEAVGLTKLVFGRSCFWRSKSIQNLSEVLKGMHSLSTLHIHYICQPHMLQGLADSCPQLLELSLKGSKDITNKEVDMLLGFIHLETLDITGTSITGRGSRSLVINLPKLAWFTHCPFNCNSDTLIFESRAELFGYIKDQLTRQPIITRNGQSLSIEAASDVPVEQAAFSNSNDQNDNHNTQDSAGLSVNTEKDNASNIMTLNLKSFWLFNTTTEELLLTQICPYLEHLRLDFVMQDLPEVPDMESIGSLLYLTSLALYTYDRCPVELVTSVLDTASRLTTLHLHLGDEWFFVAPVVNVIAQNCSNLTCLTMEGDYKGKHSLEESDARLDFTLPPEGLRQLVTATLSGCVTDLRLLHLLTQAPNLETLHLDGELEWIHDDMIADAIRQNLLLNIKVLWFNVSAGITFSSVRRLLQSENNLQRIGRLCLMSSATKDGYLDLLYFLKRFNISTELVWVTDQRQLHIDAQNRPAERFN